MDERISTSKPEYMKQWERMAKNLVPDDFVAFGDLQVVEVYFYYDGPKLFSLYSKSKDTYLFTLFVEESEDFSTFLYLPLTPKDFDSVIDCRKDLHSAFKMSKTGTVWAITFDHSSRDLRPIIEEKAVNWISKNWLPNPGAFLGDALR